MDRSAKVIRILSIVWLIIGMAASAFFFLGAIAVAVAPDESAAALAVFLILAVLILVSALTPLLVILVSEGAIAIPFVADRIFRDWRKRGRTKAWRDELAKLRAHARRPIGKATLSRLGLLLYRHYLNEALEDLQFSEDELAALQAISDEFALPQSEVNRIKAAYALKAVQSLSEKFLEDRHLSEVEKNAILTLGKHLGLSEIEIDAISRTGASKVYAALRNEALADRRISPEEEAELSELRQQLGLTDKDVLLSGKAAEEYTYYRLLHEIESGRLPEISAPVALAKGEKAHILVSADRLLSKVVTTGYAGGSRGVSVRIAKGISYRIGSYKGHPIREEVSTAYPGTLLITGKRIVFTSAAKPFTIPLAKLDSFEPFAGGIGLQKGSTYYLLRLREVDMVALAIQALVRGLRY